MKQEKYKRNQEKFNDAKKRFEENSKKVVTLLDIVQIKIDSVLNEICFKFTQDAEIRFYQEM